MNKTVKPCPFCEEGCCFCEYYGSIYVGEGCAIINKQQYSNIVSAERAKSSMPEVKE